MPKGSYVTRKNDALLIPSGPDEKKHLYFILTEPFIDGQHLTVGISSKPSSGFFDNTCMLKPADHAFIKHESYVYYRRPEIISATKIAKFIKLKYYIPQQQASEELIERVSQGLLESDFTPKYYQNYYENQII